MTSSLKQLVFGERSVTKVAGLYSSEKAAKDARSRLLASGGWAESQVLLLAPADAAGGRRKLIAQKMEPETGGIFKTILRAHLITGIGGIGIGLLVWWALRASGNAMIVASPGLSLFAVAFFGMVFGLIGGGVISLRPDHASVLDSVHAALAAGQWATVAHPLDERQAVLAVEVLGAGSTKVERTL